MKNLMFLFLCCLSCLQAQESKAMIGIIFDCDGVLVDTEYLKFLSWKEALNFHGIDFTIDNYRPLIGLSGEEILKRIEESKAVELPRSIIESNILGRSL